ncbi:hypothetical protein KQX54_007006 [Cotesia glomerata]|uniref:Uncharacterized protein n=1 Tax=Cotesia glomerata TaxID=32391 RepID=A0AAV7HWN5_COTGL|nr:hypothetical protein KQX54_007006 [Cotesia glomerata]
MSSGLRSKSVDNECWIASGINKAIKKDIALIQTLSFVWNEAWTPLLAMITIIQPSIKVYDSRKTEFPPCVSGVW